MLFQHSCETVRETSNIPVVSPTGVRERELNNFIFPLSFPFKENEKACATLTEMNGDNILTEIMENGHVAIFLVPWHRCLVH